MDNKPLAGTLVREYMYSEYFSCCQIPPLLYTYVAAVVPPPHQLLNSGAWDSCPYPEYKIKTSSFILLVCSWRYVGHSSASLQIGHLLPVTEHYLRLFLSPLLQVALESFHGLQCNVGSFVCWQKGQLWHQGSPLLLLNISIWQVVIRDWSTRCSTLSFLGTASLPTHPS